MAPMARSRIAMGFLMKWASSRSGLRTVPRRTVEGPTWRGIFWYFRLLRDVFIRCSLKGTMSLSFASMPQMVRGNLAFPIG